jgi:hypothetical protein
MATVLVPITDNGDFDVASFGPIDGKLIGVRVVVGDTGGFSITLHNDLDELDYLQDKGDSLSADTVFSIGDDEATGIPLQLLTGEVTLTVSGHTTGSGAVYVQYV